MCKNHFWNFFCPWVSFVIKCVFVSFYVLHRIDPQKKRLPITAPYTASSRFLYRAPRRWASARTRPWTTATTCWKATKRTASRGAGWRRTRSLRRRGGRWRCTGAPPRVRARRWMWARKWKDMRRCLFKWVSPEWGCVSFAHTNRIKSAHKLCMRVL